MIRNRRTTEICIIDFGLSAFGQDRLELQSVCGSPNFIDPELFKGVKYTEKSDIFSLGSILFFLMTRQRVFKGDTAKEMLIANK